MSYLGHLEQNEGCNDYLEASGCTTFTTRCTDPLNVQAASQLNEADKFYRDYNLDRPDLVIYPSDVPEAVEAYKWKGGNVSAGTPAPTFSGSQDGQSYTAEPTNPSTALATPSSEDAVIADGGESPPQRPYTHNERPPPEVIPGHMSWAWAEVLIEVKKSRHLFPFLHGEDAEFVPSGNTHVLARRQIAEYALEVFRHQHRQAVFVLLILDDHARFVRFDHGGAVVSSAFNYYDNPRIMGEFFYRLFNEHAREEQRGRDPTARLVQDTSAVQEFRQLYMQCADQPDVADALKLAGTEGWPIYDLELTGAWSQDGDTPLTTSSPSRMATHLCRVGCPSFATASVVGRGTRCFVGYDMEFKRPIFIKDTWRVDSPAVCPEADHYKTIWGRAAELVAIHEQTQTGTTADDCRKPPPPTDPYIPTLIYCGDVFCGDGAMQRTLTQDLSTTTRYSLRIHHRLALKEICQSIENFRWPIELVVGVYSALRCTYPT